MEIGHRPGARHGNADAMSRLVTPNGDLCKQCEMPWDYEYSGPGRTEIRNMREERDNESVDLLSDESSAEEENRDPTASPDHGSPAEPAIDAPRQGSVLRRGRIPNRPKPLKQKPVPLENLTDMQNENKRKIQ